jgi:hypothetical protein
MFFYHVKQWWDRQGWGVLFLGSLLVLFFLWFFYSRHRETGTSNATMDNILETVFKPWYRTPPPSSSLPLPRLSQAHTQTSIPGGDKNMSKGEKKCKEFVEFITGKRFDKVRPEFLKNPVTGHPLELDLYNEELRLAIEYNGSQHYQFNAMMHNNNKDRFQNQQYRDLIKKQLCEQHGVRLVLVPYTVPEDKIPGFLYDQLKSIGVI